MARILEIARSLTRCQPNASACAPAATLVRSIDSRCRIHRVQRRVVFARGSAICGMRCWKILVAHSGLSQMKRGNRTCSFVGWPTIGRSVSLRSMWSRSRPGLSQSAQIGSMLTGEQNKCVNSPATAASSMVTPSSTVRQMLSASRLAVAFKAGPGDLRRWREEPSSSHAPGPLHLVPHGLRAGPLATHSETGRARLRDHVQRKVTDLPIVGHPTRLHVRVPRFTCDNTECETRIFQQRMPALAEERAKPTRRCSRWILQRLAIDRTSVSAVAKALGLGWDLVNDLAVSETRAMVYDQPGHFDGVRILGVDEHKWKHVRGD